LIYLTDLIFFYHTHIGYSYTEKINPKAQFPYLGLYACISCNTRGQHRSTISSTENLLRTETLPVDDKLDLSA